MWGDELITELCKVPPPPKTELCHEHEPYRSYHALQTEAASRPDALSVSVLLRYRRSARIRCWVFSGMSDARKKREGRGGCWCIKAGQPSVCVSHQPRDDDVRFRRLWQAKKPHMLTFNVSKATIWKHLTHLQFLSFFFFFLFLWNPGHDLTISVAIVCVWLITQDYNVRASSWSVLFSHRVLCCFYFFLLKKKKERSLTFRVEKKKQRFAAAL